MPRCNQRRYFSLTKAGIFLQLLVIIFSSIHHNFFFREYICSLSLIKTTWWYLFLWKKSVILRKKVCNTLPQCLRIFYWIVSAKWLKERQKDYNAALKFLLAFSTICLLFLHFEKAGRNGSLTNDQRFSQIQNNTM